MSWNHLPEETRRQAEEVLTRKQLDVLKLWLNGYGTARIALQLDIAEATARGHLTRAQQKLKMAKEAA